MKVIFLFLAMLVNVPAFAKAEDGCVLKSGQAGNLLNVQYTFSLSGSFREQKQQFSEILRTQLDDGGIFEVVEGSASVTARSAKVCVSQKLRPLLVEELLRQAGFRIGNNDTDVDATN